MRKSMRMAIIAIILAMIFALIAISLPTLFAAEKITIGSNSHIKYLTTSQQVNEINNNGTGLKAKADSEGNVSLIENPEQSMNTNELRMQHQSLIDDGILRYALYNGSLCQNTTSGIQLIVILDFSNYNINKFEAGFLNSLVPAILGSTQFIFGCNFTEYNYDQTNADGSISQKAKLTVFDSKNGGTIVTDKIKLTLKGIYERTTITKNSTITNEETGKEDTISNYSVRIILPSNQKSTIRLEAKSLVLESSVDGITPSKTPDCIALGISHLSFNGGMQDPDVIDASTVKVINGASENSHFHWMCVTDNQMRFGLYQSLNKILFGMADEAYNSADVYEVFRKPDMMSDFSYLYLKTAKVKVNNQDKIQLTIYDPPTGTISYTEKGIVSILHLFYWMECIYVPNVQYRYNSTDPEIKINYTFSMDQLATSRHYRRNSHNEIGGGADITLGADSERIALKPVTENGVTYYVEDTAATGKTLRPVHCAHSLDESSPTYRQDGIIGYYNSALKENGAPVSNELYIPLYQGDEGYKEGEFRLKKVDFTSIG